MNGSLGPFICFPKRLPYCKQSRDVVICETPFVDWNSHGGLLSQVAERWRLSQRVALREQWLLFFLVHFIVVLHLRCDTAVFRQIGIH